MVNKVYSKIEFILGDITAMPLDAIVNSANHTLLGGAGVDGAIHEAAGPMLRKECELLNGCKDGEAKITKGYKLPAKFVIHTVGPIWFGGVKGQEEKMLKKTYESCLALAEKNNIQSIAFPSISTGEFGYPLEEAAPVAIKTVINFLKKSKVVKLVIFVLFSDYDFKIYSDCFNSISQK